MNQFMDFVRARSSSCTNDRDLELAGDVRRLQLMLFSLLYTSGIRAPLCVVEIGVADGSTTIPLLMAARELGVHVHSVDPSQWSIPDSHGLVERCGLKDGWTFHNMTSDEFFRGPGKNLEIGFGYVDGDHRWDYVARDFDNLLNRIPAGGFLVSHDWGTVRPHQLRGIAYGVDERGDDLDAHHGACRGGYTALPKWADVLTIMPFAPWPGEWRPENTSEGGFCVMQKNIRESDLSFVKTIYGYGLISRLV